MATLAEIRAKLQAQSSKPQGEGQIGDNAIYPHWNIPENSEAVLRFLPDGNKDNTFFWTERAMIKLPFNSVKGDASSGPVQVQIPCMEMYGDACPILAEVTIVAIEVNVERIFEIVGAEKVGQLRVLVQIPS